MKNLRILVVDDDTDILELLEYNLSREGFKIKTVSNSAKALRVAWEFCPDLIILDIMMPHPNGIELCREFRNLKQFENTVIFFLTAKSETYYQQAAFNIGGDDYVEKMMGLRSLTFKINSVLKKRFVIRKSRMEVHAGTLVVSRKSGTVHVSGRELVVSQHELDLLFFLAQNTGRVVSSANLTQLVWSSEWRMNETRIEQHVDNLNAKLGHVFIQKLADHHFKLKA